MATTYYEVRVEIDFSREFDHEPMQTSRFSFVPTGPDDPLLVALRERRDALIREQIRASGPGNTTFF